MRSDAATVDEYLAALPADRRETIELVRDVVVAALPTGYEEEMAWGMISYDVPLARHADTYNGKPLMYAALAAQQRYCSLYLSAVYADADALERFRTAYLATGKRLDMGKSCVRFRTLDDLPLDLVAETIAATSVDDFVRIYEAARS